MTVPSSTRKSGPYIGDGVNTAFPFDFKVFTKEDVQPVFTNSDGNESDLVLDSDYTVLLNLDQDQNPGGTVTYPVQIGATNLSAAERLTLIGGMVVDQQTDITNVGRFLPQVQENAFDKLTILIQQLQEVAGRTLRAAVGTTVKLVFPAPSSGKFIRWNTALTGLENVDAGTDSMVLQGLLADAANPAHGSGMVGFRQAGAGASLRTVLSKLRERIDSRDFGAVGGGTVDDTVALQALFDAAAGRVAQIPPGTYKCTASLELKGDLLAPGVTLKFVGASMGGAVNACIYQTAQGSISGLTIDAVGVSSCRAGLWVNADFQQTRQCRYDLTVRNVSNNDNTQPAYGVIVVRLSGSAILDGDFDIKANVINVHATANGVIGDAAGAARGIGTSFNGAGCYPQVRIHDSYVENITSGTLPFGEDADGIGLVQVDHAAAGAGGIYLIENCTVKDAMGRGFKIQAPNVVVSSCVSNGQCYESFTTFSPNTRFINDKAYNSGQTCLSINGSNCVITGFYGESTNFAQLRIYTVADNTQVSDSTFVYNATVPIDKTLRACVFAENKVSFTNVVFRNTSGQGTGVRCLGATNLKMSNCDISSVEYGVALDASANGLVLIENCAITASVDGMIRAGNSALTVNVSKTNIAAGSRGINLYSSAGANAATGRLSNCTITAGTDGVTSAPGSSTRSCNITSTASPSTSQGIAILNGSEASGNTVSLFNFNYVYTNTTNCVVMNNVSVSPVTTAFLKTGYTAFAEANNFSR